ncbi:unnamed protein product [Oppiella nova]|uniref:Protein kinase domain-containing protein n=1 Tax=Oppiella nova TaxID=334625 RepID=A0A7R9MD28_9ACAR|nr:unnamed protein product [Oppiella nova]CAG2175134.1 unnamed protein product [Oppiella nova]
MDPQMIGMEIYGRLLMLRVTVVSFTRYKPSDSLLEVLRDERLLFDEKDITLKEVVGVGNYGCVYAGALIQLDTVRHRDVAVKKLISYNL